MSGRCRSPCVLAVLARGPVCADRPNLLCAAHCWTHASLGSAVPAAAPVPGRRRHTRPLHAGMRAHLMLSLWCRRCPGHRHRQSRQQRPYVRAPVPRPMVARPAAHTSASPPPSTVRRHTHGLRMQGAATQTVARPQHCHNPLRTRPGAAATSRTMRTPPPRPRPPPTPCMLLLAVMPIAPVAAQGGGGRTTTRGA